MQEKISSEDLVRQLLVQIGEDPNRPGLLDTPKRVAKMWGEIFRGYQEEHLPDITVCANGADGIFYRDMIIDQGYFFSHCEHHMVPFFGRYWFSYIPDQWIIGASKIARVVDHHSAKLQVAERLVHNVADTLEEKLRPKGLMLIMSARHLCKEMRGIRKVNSPFDVDAVRGCFEGNPAPSCKMEFLMRIGSER